jgi:hypothetical protein
MHYLCIMNNGISLYVQKSLFKLNYLTLMRVLLHFATSKLHKILNTCILKNYPAMKFIAISLLFYYISLLFLKYPILILLLLIMEFLRNPLLIKRSKIWGLLGFIINPLLIHYYSHYYSLLFPVRHNKVFSKNTHHPPYMKM